MVVFTIEEGGNYYLADLPEDVVREKIDAGPTILERRTSTTPSAAITIDGVPFVFCSVILSTGEKWMTVVEEWSEEGSFSTVVDYMHGEEEPINDWTEPINL